MADAKYIKGAELNDVALTWNHPVTGLYTDFVSGWTFKVRVGERNGPGILEKVGPTGFTPSATAPNMVIAWAAGELDVLPVGVHDVDIEAKHTATGKDRKGKFTIEIEAEVGAVP